LSEADAGAYVIAPLENLCRPGPRTMDVGGDAATKEVGDALIAEAGKLVG
jgi:hypothetical protein